MPADVIPFVPRPDSERRPHLGGGVWYPFIRPGQVVCAAAARGQPQGLVQRVWEVRQRVEEGKQRRDRLRRVVAVRAPALLLTPAPHPLRALAATASRALLRRFDLTLMAYAVGSVLLIPDGPLLGAAMFAPPVAALGYLLLEHFRSARPHHGAGAAWRHFRSGPAGVFLQVLLCGLSVLGFVVVPLWNAGLRRSAIIVGVLAVTGVIAAANLFKLLRQERTVQEIPAGVRLA